MEVYDAGLNFGLFYQTLTAVLVAPVAILVSFDLGMVIVLSALRWFRRIS